MGQSMGVVERAAARVEYETRRLEAIKREFPEVMDLKEKLTRDLEVKVAKLALLIVEKHQAVRDLERATKRRDDEQSSFGKAVLPPPAANFVGGDQKKQGHADKEEVEAAGTGDLARLDAKIEKAEAKMKNVKQDLRIANVRLSSLRMKKNLTETDLRNLKQELDDAKAEQAASSLSPPSAASFADGDDEEPPSDGDDEDPPAAAAAAAAHGGVYDDEVDGYLSLDKVADHEYVGCEESVGASNSGNFGGAEDNQGDDGADQP